MQDIASNIDEAIRRTTPYCFYNYYNFRSKAIMIIMENPGPATSKENKKFLLMEVEKYNAWNNLRNPENFNDFVRGLWIPWKIR